MSCGDEELMEIEEGTWVEVLLGFVRWQDSQVPYAQKIIEGEIILKNKSAEILSFLNGVVARRFSKQFVPSSEPG